MPDEIDRLQEIELQEHEAHMAQARAGAAIPTGEPGECSECGRDVKRLVRGRCAPCRDGRWVE